MIALDQIDCAILRALQNNARLSNKELAAMIGLSPSSCLERVRRLQENGVFSGFHAELSPKKVGIGLQAMIAVKLNKHIYQEVDAFRNYAVAHPSVVAVYHVAGGNDFLLHVAVKDADHLRSLVLSAFTTRPEVAHIETALIYEYTHSHETPIYVKHGGFSGN